MRQKLSGKTLILTVFLTLILLCQTSLLVMASEAKKAPVLKVDRQDILQLPRNFRTANDPFKTIAKDGKMPSREGLADLHISGSSIFSELELTQLLAKIPSKKVIIVDLRQESHGFLDGMAVSWFADNNWGNDGKTLEQVMPIERALLDTALANSPVAIYKYNDSNDTLGDTFQLAVTSARTEEEVVRAHGAGYYRFALADHFRPDDAEVDKFIKFYKQMPRDTWLHFHCYAGMGRTTIFMAMTDILKNAKKVSFDDIMKRQALVGIVDLREVPDTKKNWKRKAYIERAQFIKHFYDYVKQSPENLPVSWSEWAKKHDY